MEIKQGGFLISKIHQLSGRIFSKKLREHDVEEINSAQGRILFSLWQHDGVSIQELAEATSLGKSTLTSMLDRMECSGHIKRASCHDDRRKTLIYVTDKDHQIKSAYIKVVHEMTLAYYSGFTSEEIDAFEGYLERVFSNLLKLENPQQACWNQDKTNTTWIQFIKGDKHG